jgi:hypothetical protein
MIGEGEVGLQSTEAQKEKEKEVVVEGFTRHRPIVMSVHMEEVQLAGGGAISQEEGLRRWRQEVAAAQFSRAMVWEEVVQGEDTSRHRLRLVWGGMGNRPLKWEGPVGTGSRLRRFWGWRMGRRHRLMEGVVVSAMVRI